MSAIGAGREELRAIARVVMVARVRERNDPGTAFGLADSGNAMIVGTPLFPWIFRGSSPLTTCRFCTGFPPPGIAAEHGSGGGRVFPTLRPARLVTSFPPNPRP